MILGRRILLFLQNLLILNTVWWMLIIVTWALLERVFQGLPEPRSFSHLYLLVLACRGAAFWWPISEARWMRSEEGEWRSAPEPNSAGG